MTLGLRIKIVKLFLCNETVRLQRFAKRILGKELFTSMHQNSEANDANHQLYLI